ncbi:MAG: T9SS type A sorting domain-containing protein [Bacteroidetes bacterium]|nr:T9SS type A sorting domain-containing protein [Bacteroidota bacterium]
MNQKLITHTIAILIFLFNIIDNKAQNDWETANKLNTTAGINIFSSAIDSDDNLYVIASFQGDINNTEPIINAYGNFDIFIAKYNSDLERQWINHIGGTGGEYYASLTLDEQRNIYVSGGFNSKTYFSLQDSLENKNFFDAFIAKYNTNGQLIWTKNVANGPSWDVINNIDLDKNNNLIVTGFFQDSIYFENDTLNSQGSANQYNFYAQFDTSGNFNWVKNLPCNSNLTRITNVRAFNDGYYFTGYFQNTIEFEQKTIDAGSNYDIVLFKTDLNGNESWIRQSYSSSGNNGILNVTQDNYGGIYTAGFFDTDGITVDSTESIVSKDSLKTTGSEDIFLFKYNKNGRLQWSKRYGGSKADRPLGISQRNDIIYVTGFYTDSITLQDDTLTGVNNSTKNPLLATFDLDGNILKATGLNGTGEGDDRGVSVVLDNTNKAYVIGDYSSNSITIGDSTFNLNATKDIFLGRYNPPYSAAYTTVDKISCNGDTNGRLIATPYFGVPPYSYNWSPNVTDSNDSLAYNLGAGTYSVTITDALANSTSETIELNQPSAVNLALDSINNTSCFNGNDGEIFISVSGGTAQSGYNYNWSGGSGANPEDEDQNGLSAADYIVQVTDDNACAAIDTFTVGQPAQIRFTGSATTGTTTEGGSDGSIDLEVVGGTPGYGYSWTGPAGPYPDQQDLTGLIGGNYTVMVTDTNSCTADTTLNVDDAGNIVLSISNLTPVTCKNDSNGAVITNVEYNDYSIRYTYKKNDTIIHGPEVGKFSLANLPGGTYWAIGQEVAGSERIDSVQFIIQEASDSLTTALDASNPSCHGYSDGVINLNTSGGRVPYDYLWSYNGETTEDLSSLPASGEYYKVTVTDDFGCQKIDSIQLTQPAAITSNITIDQIIFCNGESSGKLTSHASGGVSPLSFFWDDPGNQTDSTATNLNADFYEVEIIDQNQCSITDTITLSEPDEFVLNSIDSANVTCYNGNDGAISFHATGGTTPHQFIWTDASNDSIRNELSAGTYTVTVSDLYECNQSVQVISIDQPASALTVDTLPGSVDPVTCFGHTDGALEITATGGWGGNEYAFDDGMYGAQTAYPNLPGGTYEIKVRDNKGCVDSMDIDINEPDELVAGEYMPDHTDVSCNGLADGLLTATKTGGNSTFEFSLDNTNWFTDSTFSDLPADTYRIRIRDNKNCADSVDITIQEPDVLNIAEVTGNHQDVSCYGHNDGVLMVTKTGGNDTFEFQQDNNGWVSDSLFENLAAAAYQLKVRDNLGCMDSINIDITEPDSLILTTDTQTDPSCFGLDDGTAQLAVSGGNAGFEYSDDQINWNTVNTFNDLTAGLYTFYARDNMGCLDSTELSLNDPDELVIAEDTTSHVNVLCHGYATGELAVTAMGGTGTLEYTIDDVNYQSSPSFTGLHAGNHKVKVRDANNCPDSITINISQPSSALSTDVTIVDATCHGDTDGSISLSASGGTSPYSFSSDHVNWQANGDFDDLSPTTYTVYTRDANQCLDTTEAIVEEPQAISVVKENLDGTNISVSAVGGTGNLSYSMNDLVQDNGEFTVSKNGTYIVTITDALGCEAQSTPFEVQITSVGQHNRIVSGKIYPNPAKDMLHIELFDLEPGEPYELIIHSIEGRIVRRKMTVTNTNGSINEQLNVSHVASGMYMIRLNGRVLPQKLIKE